MTPHLLTPTISPTLATFWDWLLGIHLAGGGISLGWRHPLPNWAWVLIILAAAAFAGLTYGRLLGPRRARLGLAGVRALTLLAIVTLLAGPLAVQLIRDVQPDTLIVLVDRSASMQVKDTMSAQGQAVSRSQALTTALDKNKALFSDTGLGHNRKVLWLGFGAHAFPIDSPDSKTGLGPADRDATNIRTSIQQALARVAGSPVAGIVLMTDGQTPQSTGAPLVNQLRRAGVSVFSVPVGAKQLPLDFTLASVRAPAESFQGDLVPIRVIVDQIGGPPESTSHLNLSDIHVELLDAEGKILDQTTLAHTGLNQPVHLSAAGKHAGMAHWRVRVVYNSPASASKNTLHEVNLSNNQQPVNVRIIDRPIRVLYVEGYPRWAYRYLKNLLIREKSIACSVLLLSSNAEGAEEGDIPITHFPDTAKQLKPYDVIILGDIAPDALSDAQLKLIKNHVSQDGAGLLWIGGSRYMPTAWAGTALSELLPMRDPGSVTRLVSPSSGIDMEPTPAARSLNILHLVGPDTATGQTWPSDLPALQWAQNLGPLKPATDILARAATPKAHAPPLIVRMRYGAGQSLYVATDEIWRWRYARGDIYFQQFWIELIRMLARSSLAAGAGRAQLTVSQRTFTAGDTVLVKLTTQDPAIIQRGLGRIEVQVNHVGAADQDNAADELTLILDPSQSNSGRQVFQAQWQPATPGKRLLTVTQPGLADLHLQTPVTVASATGEMRHPQTDFARLAALSKATGGAVVPLDHLAELKKLVPDRARINERDSEHPLWHSPLALIVVVILLTAEWIGRKTIRLV